MNAFFTDEEMQAWTPFIISVLHLLAVLDAELKERFNISHLDYGILMLLSQSNGYAQRMKVLATTFGVDPSNITYRARRMEAQGLVKRSTDSSDGRVVWLLLTDEGITLLRQAQVVHVASARRHFLDHLDPTQLHTINTIFSHLHSFQQSSEELAYVEHPLSTSDEGGVAD